MDIDKLTAENQKGANTLFNDVPLRTRKALLPKILYSDNAILVLSRTSLNIVITPFWLSTQQTVMYISTGIILVAWG